MKKFIIFNYKKISLGLAFVMLGLVCIGLAEKNFKYLDSAFYLLLITLFLIYFFLRKELLVMLITKENKELKTEELMKCDTVFLEKILYFTRAKRERLKKNVEIEEKILGEIFKD